MTTFGFKVIRSKKFLENESELEDKLNAFFNENKNLIPRGISMTGIGSTTWLAAVVLYEDSEKK